MNTCVSDDDSGDSETLGLRESSPESSKGSDTVRVVSKSRKFCACGKHANFGRPGTKIRSHCARCKTDGFVNITSRKCIACLRVEPSFGKLGTRRATHCKACKPGGFVNVVSKRCVCGIAIPVFATKLGDRPTRCARCQLPGWIDVRNKKCHCGKSQPSFGERIGDMATRCGKCKLPGWIDVKSRKCACGSQPSFGEKLGDRPTRCAACRLPGWINVQNKRCVCGIAIPVFAAKLGDRPTRCARCQLPDWINVRDKRCLTEGCDTQVKNNIYCANCDPEPGRRRKVKERRVFEALCAAGLVPSKYDKVMADTACGLSRPDFNYDIPDRSILVECDENQHNPSTTNYTPECELRRMIDLHAASGGLPTIIVRFNPDPFELDGTTQNIHRKIRHEALFAEIRRAMNIPAPLPGTLSVTYMYFDKITCAGIPPTDRGILRRYVIDTCDPQFPVTREPV